MPEEESKPFCSSFLWLWIRYFKQIQWSIIPIKYPKRQPYQLWIKYLLARIRVWKWDWNCRGFFQWNVSEQKFIVFESGPNQLIYMIMCSICDHPVNDVSKSLQGSMLKVEVECFNGHSAIKCNCQLTIGRMTAGNIVGCAETVFAVETYQHMSNFAQFNFNWAFIGKTAWDLLVAIINAHIYYTRII